MGIMKEIVRLNLPELASPIVYELYKCIETDFNPLRIAPKVQKMLTEIEEMNNPAYSQYSDSIKLTVAAKVVKQVCLKCHYFHYINNRFPAFTNRYLCLASRKLFHFTIESNLNNSLWIFAKSNPSKLISIIEIIAYALGQKNPVWLAIWKIQMSALQRFSILCF